MTINKEKMKTKRTTKNTYRLEEMKRIFRNLYAIEAKTKPVTSSTRGY
jgi:hypothetical protein